ncbi:MAG: TRAP transporter large permease [Oscillospiraceae bacterium]|nr:TRAP transporter large permease [Oscillospiraceae bacterium]
MSTTSIGFFGVALMLFLLFTGVEIGFSFIGAGMVGIGLMLGFKGSLSVLKTIPLSQSLSYTLAVLPMFMLLGDFAVTGDLTSDAYGAARKWLGHRTAGLAITSTVSSAVFGAISGSASATAMVMTRVAWPEMKKYGYEPSLGLSSIAAAGPLAILIPPSTPMIVFGILSNTSVGKLFMGGWIPGIILTVMMCSITVVLVKIHPERAPKTEKAPMKERFRSLSKPLPIFILIIVIMYCIWGGVTTVNEAAGVAVICCLIIVIAKRRAGIKKLWKALVEGSSRAAGLFFMFIGIQVFNSFLSMSKLPTLLTNFIISLPFSPYTVIWCIVGLYFILGMFIDAAVMMMLTVPLIYPVVVALGFDLVWYGIISALCSALALITPPVGGCLFVIGSQTPDIPLSLIMRGVWPYVIAIFATIALVIYIPQLALFLPSKMI